MSRRALNKCLKWCDGFNFIQRILYQFFKWSSLYFVLKLISIIEWVEIVNKAQNDIKKISFVRWKFIGESKQIEAAQKVSPFKFSSLNLDCLSWIFLGLHLTLLVFRCMQGEFGLTASNNSVKCFIVEQEYQRGRQMYFLSPHVSF